MNKIIVRPAIIAALLLLIPLALQLTIGTGIDGQGWNWKPGDFVFAFAAFFATGVAYQLLAVRFTEKKHRIMIGIIVFLGLLFVWGNAVNDFDLLESLVLRIIG
jgi:hypothetical protein